MDNYLKQRKVQLHLFADEYGLRNDWHEPDEQDVTAVVTGCHLGNTMGENQSTVPPYYHEFVVHLFVDESHELSINLATLLAIAAS